MYTKDTEAWPDNAMCKQVSNIHKQVADALRYGAISAERYVRIVAQERIRTKTTVSDQAKRKK